MAAPPVPPSRIADYLATIPDPFPQLNSLLEAYKPEAAPTPGTCWDRTDSHGYILCFLGTYKTEPLVLTLPHVTSLPGFTPEKQMLAGDVTAEGQLPPIVELTSHAFHLIQGNHDVFDNGSTTQAWTNNPGRTTLPPVAAANANVESLRCRKMVPIPHEFVVDILRAQDQGTLTWRWLWTTIISGKILGDAAREGQYQYLIEYARIASTESQGGLAPPTDFAFGFGPTPANNRTQALNKLKSFLPGLAQPNHINAQFLQLQHQQQQQHAALLAAQNAAGAPPTLQSEMPQLYPMLLRICEVNSEAQLPAFYQGLVSMKSARWFSHGEQCLSATCVGLNISRPILSPPLVNDLATGQFTGVGITEMTKGFSIFRFMVEGAKKAGSADERNATYNILSTGGGVIQADAVRMMFAANEIYPPANTTEFQTYLEGYYGMLVTFIGEHSRATGSYKTAVYDRVRAIASTIERQFSDPGAHRDAWIKVMVYLAIETDHYFTQLLHPPAGGGAPTPPDYEHIYQRVRRGQVRDITTIPEDLLTPATPPATPAPTQEGGSGADRNTNNQEIRRPNQNRNLKAAWAATQFVGIFRGSNAPYKDPNSSDGKKHVKCDAPDARDVCLPMALTGKCFALCRKKHDALSDGEVQRVAAAGGFTV